MLKKVINAILFLPLALFSNSLEIKAKEKQGKAKDKYGGKYWLLEGNRADRF